jgi:hypothetical protein
MYELGYFECLKNHRNAILILDESVSQCVPSMLRGHYITRYDIYNYGFVLYDIYNHGTVTSSAI